MDKGERERKPESESKSNFSLEFLHHLCQYLFIGCPIDFNFLVECKRPNAKFFAKQHQLERYTSSNTWSAFCFDTTQTQFGFVLHCTFSYLPYTFIIRIYLSLDPSFRSFHDSAAVVIEKINIAAEKMKNHFHHVWVFFVVEKEEFMRLKVLPAGWSVIFRVNGLHKFSSHSCIQFFHHKKSFREYNVRFHECVVLPHHSVYGALGHAVYAIKIQYKRFSNQCDDGDK